MTSKMINIPLAEQRQLLRLQLQAQRLVITAQLEQKVVESQNYPRSIIMRFLTQQNGAKIIAELAAVTIGTRWLRSSYTKTLTKIFKSLFPGTPKT